MKRTDILTLIGIGLITGLVSLIISGIVFNPPKKDMKVPSVDTLTTSFPDVANDPSYNNFLNEQALDPTQPVQIGQGQNRAPFNSSQ